MRACLHTSADQIKKIIIEDSNAREEEGVKQINTSLMQIIENGRRSKPL